MGAIPPRAGPRLPALPLLQRRLQGAQGSALLHYLVGHLGAVGGGRGAGGGRERLDGAPTAPCRPDTTGTVCYSSHPRSYRTGSRGSDSFRIVQGNALLFLCNSERTLGSGV